ncbi:MAG: SDR family oxidoreductase [Flavobacteriales bacterium]
MNRQQQKVLVTGGAGFIGSNLCDALLDKGYAVTCLDNFATGKRSNIEHHASNSHFRLIEGDIRDYSTCLNACEGVDFVLHQAALGSVPRSIQDPITSNEVNVSGFLNMMNAARIQGVQRFVYAGSSSTYGDSPGLPKIEEVTGNPLSPYAITKMVIEHYARVFHQVYGFNSIGLRYFNVFGRRQDPNGAYAAVIPKFVMQFLNGESPVINGDGNFSRDFTYIDNVIQANILAMTTSNDAALNQVYNVACGERTNLNEMVDLLKRYLTVHAPHVSEVNAIYGSGRAGDIPHSLASIDKAKNLLGYAPSHLFADGLKEAVEWYVKHL